MNALGQVAIPIRELSSDSEGYDDEHNASEIFGDRQFIGRDDGLWVRSANGESLNRIDIVKGSVSGIEVSNNLLVVTTSEGSWIFDIDENSTFVKDDIGHINCVGAFNDKIAIGTSEGLWFVSKDGKRLDKVQSLQVRVNDIKAVGDQMFLSVSSLIFEIDNNEEMYEGLWMIHRDGSLTAVKDVKGNDPRIYDINGLLFVDTVVGTWIVGKDGHNVKKVAQEVHEPTTVRTFDSQIFVGTGEGLLIISQDGREVNRLTVIQEMVKSIDIIDGKLYIDTIDTRYRIDHKVKINSKLVPNSWWAIVIGYVLPANWLPSENARVTAFYSDETGNDPYDVSLARKFRFALPDWQSDRDFNTEKQFSYELSWGRNEVNYWVKDQWDNSFEQKATYYGVPSQLVFVVAPLTISAVLVLGCFALAPKVSFCHSAIMNTWLRKYFSIGSVPILLSAFPSLRRHLLRRYSASLSKDKEFSEWKNRFLCPNEEFQPENFGKKLEGERRLLLTGQSGIGKTSYFKCLTANYASKDKPTHPQKVFPIYIPLTNYGGNSLEELVYNQLFSYGKITDEELAPMFLEQGGLLIFLDGINEVQNVTDRQKLSAFVEKFWTSNYICLSSQHPYPEIENIPKVELKPFSREKVREFIRQRVCDKGIAEDVIKRLTDQDYQLYSVPRDLEFAVEILNGRGKVLPKSRTDLYKITLNSVFAKWQENGMADVGDNLCKRAYMMILQGDLAFDSVDNPYFKGVTEDLREQKFLVRGERSYNFRHDLIRSYLASEYFYPRWRSLLKGMDEGQIDSNWLEMLKFSCENIEESAEVKSLVYEVLERSLRKDLVKNLFEWLKANYPSKCRSWEKDFYAKYGKLDFK
jgi:hypothetical protein